MTLRAQISILGLPKFPFSQDNLSHVQKQREESLQLSSGRARLCESGECKAGHI